MVLNDTVTYEKVVLNRRLPAEISRVSQDQQKQTRECSGNMFRYVFWLFCFIKSQMKSPIRPENELHINTLVRKKVSVEIQNGSHSQAYLIFTIEGKGTHLPIFVIYITCWEVNLFKNYHTYNIDERRINVHLKKNAYSITGIFCGLFSAVLCGYQKFAKYS